MPIQCKKCEMNQGYYPPKPENIAKRPRTACKNCKSTIFINRNKLLEFLEQRILWHYDIRF